MPVITAEGLRKTFEDGTVALEPLDFTVYAGKITGLVGPDGAGKTTLIRILTGLLRATEGTLRVLERPMPCNTSDFLQQIGYMPQKFGLYEDLSVDENLRLYAQLQHIDHAPERIDELLAFTALTPFRTRLAGDLSGGMKQKLGLACALIKKPKLLLLDEPGVGVDPISRKELWAMVQELLREEVAVLWSTSYLDEADRCDDVLLLNQGSLLYRGSPETFRDGMRGRVYMVSGAFEKKREVLTRILEHDAVLDAVLVGSKIRVILQEGAALPREAITHLGEAVRIAPVAPIFEDAFVNILGVKTKAHSVLASHMPEQHDGPEKLIVARDLTKHFGSFVATEQIDFEIGRGEIFGFLGPNGAGKSTTFKMLCGLLTPTRGDAHVMGEDLYRAGAQVRSAIGYMAQKFSLYGDLGVRDNLEFFSGVYGLRGRKRRAKIEEMVEIFDFREYLKISAGTLPLGLKQRLALACSVMHEPRVLFLDEPTSGVDPITRKEFWTHINGMVRKGMSIMVTTHFMDEAEYCDRIMLIYRGREIAKGTPDALKALVGPDASMEESFISLIRDYDAKGGNHGR